LRKILKGSSDKSYGIHVAKLAGLPSEVIIKAQEILKGLESKGTKAAVKKPFVKKEQDQLLLFQSPSKEEPYEKVIQELKKIDIMSTTPIQALCLLEKMVGLLS
jgi:DNA mismatch repair protein MutS